MRVLVAGATGAVGRPLVTALLDAGHQVGALTRSPEAAEALRVRGVEAHVADALDGEAVAAVAEAFAPQSIINQLTALPKRLNPRGIKRAMAPTTRLRREANAHLAAAAKAADARLISQSIAFAYAPRGPAVLDESAPLWLDAGGGYGSVIEALAELERVTFRAGGIVLRYGALYGPGTYYARDGQIGRDVRLRRFPLVGEGTGVSSFLHVDDAAAAAVAALVAPAGVYNVVDDEPAALSDWLPAYAAAIGAPSPSHVPPWLARMVAGKLGVAFLLRARGADNAKAKAELGWTPRWPSWREGFESGLE